MYTKKEFNVDHAVKTLAPLKGKFTYPESGLLDDVNTELEKVIFGLNLNAESAQPIITRALYDENNDGVLTKAKFTFKPTTHDALTVDAVRSEFILPAGANFYNAFIDQYAAWQDKYEYYRRLQVNLDELNQVVQNIISTEDIPYSLEFSLGNEIVDATDSAAVLGLTEQTVRELRELPLFDFSFAARQEGYHARLVELLKSVDRPAEIVKQKTLVTDHLGVYSRRGLHKLIREFVKRKQEFTRVGEGYVDTEEYFAVVQKVAVTPEEVEAYEEGTFLVLDNTDANVREKATGKTKILVSYRIAPFNKETREPVEVSLEDALKVVHSDAA